MKKWLVAAAVVGVLVGGSTEVGAAEMSLFDNKFAIEWPVLVTAVRPSDGGDAFVVVKNNQRYEVLEIDHFEIYRVKEGEDRGLAGWGLAAEKKDFLVPDGVKEPLRPGAAKKYAVAEGLLPITGAEDVYVQIGWRHSTLGGERKAGFKYDECLAAAGGAEGAVCELTADGKGNLKYIWANMVPACSDQEDEGERTEYGFWEEGYGPEVWGEVGDCGGDVEVGTLATVEEGGLGGGGDVGLSVPTTGVFGGDESGVIEQGLAYAIVVAGGLVSAWYFLVYGRRRKREDSV